MDIPQPTSSPMPNNQYVQYPPHDQRSHGDVTQGITAGMERSHISFQEDYARNGQIREQQPSQTSILRPGSSQMSMGYNAQGMPVRLPPNQYNQSINQYPVDPRHYAEQEGRFEQYQNRPNDQYDQFNRYVDQQSIQQERQVHQQVPQQYSQPPQQTQLQQQGRQQIQQHDRSRSNQPSDLPPPTRSKSVPRRRIEKDPFEGVEGGYWSKGEVLRNKERREMADRGKQVAGGQFNDTVPPVHVNERKPWKERAGEENDIPAAGYSGHIQGLRRLGVGKSFNTAAKEAKKEYVERRRALSGSREQFYSQNNSELDSTTETLNYPRPTY